MGPQKGWGAGWGRQPPGSGAGMGSGCAGSTGDASTSVRLRAGSGPGAVVQDAGDWETHGKNRGQRGGGRGQSNQGWGWGPGSEATWSPAPAFPDLPRVGRPGGLGGSLSDNISGVPLASGDDRNPRGGREMVASSLQHHSRPGSVPSRSPWRPRSQSHGIPGAEAGPEPGGMVREATGQTRCGDPEPNRSATTRAPRTPRKPAAHRGRLPAAGPRRPPYLEMAPHVLGHGVVIDVEREGELRVGLQCRRWHQDHTAGVHLPGGYGTAGSYGIATGIGTRGWERG